jgi:hypothetical protein
MLCRLYTREAACHLSRVRFLIPATLAFVCASAFGADPKRESLGRTAHQRFNPTLEEQQALVFDTRQGAAGNARSFNGGSARVKEFKFNQKVASSTFETGDFQTKKSWFGNFKFGAKSVDTRSKSGIPNANAEAPVKTAATKEAPGAGKMASVREMPGSDRPYLGPESKKLDRAVDPNKPLPGWTGDKLEVLTLEQIRELLNKNK